MATSEHASPPDRVLTIGPRQLDVLRPLWEHGPATVPQLHTWLSADPPIAYTTLQTICREMSTKGVLRRSPATDAAGRALKGHPYIYESAIAPATFTHVMVGRCHSPGYTAQ